VSSAGNLRTVPESEQTNLRTNADLIEIVRRFKLGNDAMKDSFDKAKGMTRKVKVVIAKYAVDRDGNVRKR
jgi:hypothetical protein